MLNNGIRTRNFLNRSCAYYNSHQFFLPHQNLAKSHHLSSGAKDSKPLNYIKTDIREQNIYNDDLKIYAIMSKMMVKVKTLQGFFKNPRGFSTPERGFSPTFQNGGKTLRDFIKKKYQKFIKKLVCLIVQFEEN